MPCQRRMEEERERRKQGGRKAARGIMSAFKKLKNLPLTTILVCFTSRLFVWLSLSSVCPDRLAASVQPPSALGARSSAVQTPSMNMEETGLQSACAPPDRKKAKEKDARKGERVG